MKCTRCFDRPLVSGRLPGSSSCPECLGVHLPASEFKQKIQDLGGDPTAVSALAKTGAAGRDCASCNHPTRDVMLAGSLIACCESCEGVWLDASFARRMLHSAPVAASPTASAPAPAPVDPPAAAQAVDSTPSSVDSIDDLMDSMQDPSLDSQPYNTAEKTSSVYVSSEHASDASVLGYGTPEDSASSYTVPGYHAEEDAGRSTSMSSPDALDPHRRELPIFKIGAGILGVIVLIFGVSTARGFFPSETTIDDDELNIHVTLFGSHSKVKKQVIVPYEGKDHTIDFVGHESTFADVVQSALVADIPHALRTKVLALRASRHAQKVCQALLLSLAKDRQGTVKEGDSRIYKDSYSMKIVQGDRQAFYRINSPDSRKWARVTCVVSLRTQQVYLLSSLHEGTRHAEDASVENFFRSFRLIDNRMKAQ